MIGAKWLQAVLGAVVAVVLLVGCATPTAKEPPGQSSLFKLTQTSQVTPVGNYQWGGFSRIGYVPGRDRMVVTFDTLLGHPEGECTDGGYAYREYTTDMVPTGTMGLINCYGGTMDTGGLFVGDDFYFANQAPGSLAGTEGWRLFKYNAVTWKELASTFLVLRSSSDSASQGVQEPGDPMIALVNGQIDISSTYRSATSTVTPGPMAGWATHHQFFTTDLQFVSKRVLSDTPHINMSSMVSANGIINFVTGTALFGDLIVMQYDQNWDYLRTKTLKKKSATPEGLAFDGERFYVSYLDVPCTGTDLKGCYMNVRLAAFDSNWNLLEDIAVTSFTPNDHKQPGRPSLTLHNGRIYVCYDQNEDEEFSPSESPRTSDVRVYVKVYQVSGTG
jgi:hypothetical protein